jgi:hypothetical protein
MSRPHGEYTALIVACKRHVEGPCTRTVGAASASFRAVHYRLRIVQSVNSAI